MKLYMEALQNSVCWDEVGERKLSKAVLIDQTKEIVNKIREKLRAAQNRQKSYADIRTTLRVQRRRSYVFKGVSIEREPEIWLKG